MKKLAVGVCAAVAAAVSAFAGDPFVIIQGDGASSGSRATLAEAIEDVGDGGAIELVEDATWDATVTLSGKSVTIRSAASGLHVLRRAASCAIKVQGGATLTLANVVLDGGAVWAHPAIDTNLTAAANCDLAEGSPTWDGTILSVITDEGNIIFEDGATVRNVRMTSAPGINVGGTGSGTIEIRPGATLCDNRGGRALLTVNPESGKKTCRFSMTGGLVTRCVNTRRENDKRFGGVFCFIGNGPESMSVTGGEFTGNYTANGGEISMNVYNCSLIFGGTARIVGNWCEEDTGSAGLTPTWSQYVDFCGDVRLCDNFTRAGAPANWVPNNGANLRMRGSLAATAEIRIPSTGTAGSAFGTAVDVTGDPDQANAFINETTPGLVGLVSGSSLVWTKAPEPLPEDFKGYRWTVDGGETWTTNAERGGLSAIADAANPLFLLADSSAAPAYVTTPETAIVELLSDGCTLDKTLFFDKSFTVRSGEGGPFVFKRRGRSCFQSAGTACPTMVLENVVLDGGAVWAHPAIDTNLTAAANCELAADSDASIKGTLVAIKSRPAKLVLAEGGVIRNVLLDDEAMFVVTTVRSGIEIRGGAIRDVRGPKPTMRMNPGAGVTEQSFQMTDGEITGCVCSAGSGEHNAIFSVYCKDSEPSSSFVFSGGRAHGNYTYYSGVFGSDRLAPLRMSGTAEISGNWCEMDGGTAGIWPRWGSPCYFSGAATVKDNFTRSGKPANIMKGSLEPVLVGSLDLAAEIHLSPADNKKGSGNAFGSVKDFTGFSDEANAFVNDETPGLVGIVSGASLIWTKAPDPLPEDFKGYRWTVDGGETWQTNAYRAGLSRIGQSDNPLFLLADSSAAPAYVTTPETAIVELLSDGCTLDASLYFDKSFTLRSGEGGPFVLKRLATSAFVSSGTASPTMVLENAILDGGAVWAHPAIDTSLTAAANCELAEGADAGAKGRIVSIASHPASIVLGEGGVIRNVRSPDGDDGAIYFGSGVAGSIAIRPGAEIRDVRGSGAVVRMRSQAMADTFVMTGGLVTGCVNSSKGTLEQSGLIAIYNKNNEPAVSFRFTGGTFTGNYTYKGGIFSSDRLAPFHMGGTAAIIGNWCEADDGMAGLCPVWGGPWYFSGAPVVKDNFTVSGQPANFRHFQVDSAPVIEGSLDPEACIHFSRTSKQGFGDGFGSVVSFTGKPTDGGNFVNDLLPGSIGCVSGNSIIWIPGTERQPGEVIGYRWTTDGGATWTEAEDYILGACGGILSATSNGGSADDNVIELLSDVTLKDQLSCNNSFTIRRAEGCDGRLVRMTKGRFVVNGGSVPTVRVTDLVIDGGVVWKHPEIDPTLGLEENCAYERMNGNNCNCAIFALLKASTLVFDSGAVLENAYLTYDANNENDGVIFVGANWASVAARFELREGAVIRNCRGDGPVVHTVSSATDDAFTMTGGLITGCVNKRPRGITNGMSYTGYGIVCKNGGGVVISGGVISNNFAAVGGAIFIDQGLNHVLRITGGRITGNLATEDGAGIFAGMVNTNNRIEFEDSPYVWGNVLVDCVTGATIPCDLTVGFTPWVRSAANPVYVTGSLTDKAKIGVHSIMQSVDKGASAVGADGPNDTSYFNTWAIARVTSAEIDLSNAADVFVNEVDPRYVMGTTAETQSGQLVIGWVKGPEADDAEDVAEVTDTNGTTGYRNAADAILAARRKGTATVKFLKDAILPQMTIGNNEHLTFTSDRAVTLVTHSSKTWPSAFAGSAAGGSSLEITGRVTLRHAVHSPESAILFQPRRKMSTNDEVWQTGDVILSGDATYAGSVGLSIADYNLYVSGAAKVTGTVTVGDASRLAVAGPFTGRVPVSAPDMDVFGTVSADYATPTAGDAHGFVNADEEGLCGCLSDAGLVWMRCAVTIDEEGQTDTITSDGDLTLGSTYVLKVDAPVELLNSKAGRRGKAYPLIRATSVTGKPKLVLPAGLDYKWFAKEVYEDATLVGYDLVSNGPGFMLLVK